MGLRCLGCPFLSTPKRARVIELPICDRSGFIIILIILIIIIIIMYLLFLGGGGGSSEGTGCARAVFYGDPKNVSNVASVENLPGSALSPKP